MRITRIVYLVPGWAGFSLTNRAVIFQAFEGTKGELRESQVNNFHV